MYGFLLLPRGGLDSEFAPRCPGPCGVGVANFTFRLRTDALVYRTLRQSVQPLEEFSPTPTPMPTPTLPEDAR